MKEFRSISKKLVYENPWLKVFEHEIKRRNSTGIYGVIEREDTVIAIPLSPSHRTVIVRQYRYPTNSDSWELPMGGIDEGESAESAVERELLEETKLQLLDLEKIGHYYAIPGLTDQQVYVFIAHINDEDLEKIAIPDDIDEIQEFKVVSLDCVYVMAEKGEITDGSTLASLLYLKLHPLYAQNYLSLS
jgi:8-oxo-dGTP pyrophosphatase MutT (NUDIX family)